MNGDLARIQELKAQMVLLQRRLARMERNLELVRARLKAHADELERLAESI